MSHLLVLTHQRWNFIHRRTQQLLGRMARRFHVHVVEAPVQHDGPARLLRQRLTPHLDVLVPLLPGPIDADHPGFDGDALPIVRALVADYLAERGIEHLPIAWTTTPSAQPLIAALDPRTVVYDCLEDLADDATTSPVLAAQDDALLRRADLVFAGGPALYERKRTANANVYCLPSAVDADRFAPHRLQPGCAEHRAAVTLHAALRGPRLGFYGVIDDRLDLGLVAAIADARPDWQLVMAGPVEGLQMSQLPQRDNIHWIGRQPYERLPYLLAEWDVALLPYALTHRTRCLNPTQTLEYMAAEKPVVSTALADVKALYGDTVRVAQDRMDVIAACDELLAEGPAARQRRVTDMTYAASSMSWERTAQAVAVLLAKALALKPLPAVPAAAGAGAAAAAAAAAPGARLPVLARRFPLVATPGTAAPRPVRVPASQFVLH